MKRQLQQETSTQLHTSRKPPNFAPSLSDDDTETESSAPHWVEVLVDLLLGLLSQSSLLWRSVVEQAFRKIVHHVTPGAVQLIANVREGE